MNRFKMRIAGIDPGLTGAIAVADIHGESEVIRPRVYDMPVTSLLDGRSMPCGRGVHKILSEEAPDFIILEHVESRPGQGSTSSFRFAQGFGATLSAAQLACPDAPAVHLVRPRIWKEALGLTSDKAESLALARASFPDLSDELKRQRDDGRAEALLLIQYYMQYLRPIEELEVV